MNYAKATLLVISGPNGSGKSTHIQTMLPDQFEGIFSFDRDLTRAEFARELSSQDFPFELIPKKSTEMMEAKLVEKMRAAIFRREHFVLETPLSHPDYWKYLDLFENAGYQIQLNYLCLDNISNCIARVGQRVSEGGHYVAPDTIKGVYEKNLEHIDTYRSVFKRIELFDGMTIPTLLTVLEYDEIVFTQEYALTKRWIKEGLPSIADKIQFYFSGLPR